MSDGTAPPRRLTKTHKRLLGGAGSIAIVVAVFAFFLPRVADYREVFQVVRHLDWKDWLLLVGATALNLARFPPPWMAALPGLGYRQAMAMTQASTALSIVSPAGAAVGMAGSYSMLRSWGFSAGPVGLAVAVHLIELCILLSQLVLQQFDPQRVVDPRVELYVFVRLREVVIRAGIQALNLLGRGVPGGDHDDGDPPGILVVLEPPAQLFAVHVRQDTIEQDEVEGPGHGQPEGGHSVQHPRH